MDKGKEETTSAVANLLEKQLPPIDGKLGGHLGLGVNVRMFRGVLVVYRQHDRQRDC